MCVSFSFTYTPTHLKAAEGSSTVIMQPRATEHGRGKGEKNEKEKEK